jgi:hypothetical protein
MRMFSGVVIVSAVASWSRYIEPMYKSRAFAGLFCFAPPHGMITNFFVIVASFVLGGLGTARTSP